MCKKLPEHKPFDLKITSNINGMQRLKDNNQV